MKKVQGRAISVRLARFGAVVVLMMGLGGCRTAAKIEKAKDAGYASGVEDQKKASQGLVMSLMRDLDECQKKVRDLNIRASQLDRQINDCLNAGPDK